MMLKVEHWLIATGAFASLGAIASLVAFQINRRTWGLVLALLGLAGGFASAAIVAVMLATGSESAPAVISSPMWTWFFLSSHQSMSIGFGLEATWIKASLVSLTGLIAFTALCTAGYRNDKPQDSGGFGRPVHHALGMGRSRKDMPLADDVILATSFLYASGVAFVLAPNLAQALLGWGAVSLLSAMLIRLSRLRTHPDRIDAQGGSFSKTERPSKWNSAERPNRSVQMVASGMEFVERFIVPRVWRTATIEFPTWVAEQLGSIEASSISFQLAATALCASAVLLTWLMVNV